MLWWFVILGVSTAAVVSVAMLLYVRVRRQMKHPAAHAAEPQSDEQRMET